MTTEHKDLPALPDDMDIAEQIKLNSIDSVEFADLMSAYAGKPSMDTAWAVLQYADRRMHEIMKTRFALAAIPPSTAGDPSRKEDPEYLKSAKKHHPFCNCSACINYWLSVTAPQSPQPAAPIAQPASGEEAASVVGVELKSCENCSHAQSFNDDKEMFCHLHVKEVSEPCSEFVAVFVDAAPATAAPQGQQSAETGDEFEQFEVDMSEHATGDPHIDAANFLLSAARNFWEACRQARQYGAVQWVIGDSGELLIYTRGEYRDQLMMNIETFADQPIKYIKADPAQEADVRDAALEEAADAYIIERMGQMLARIAIAVKGPEIPLHRHGYQDLPELVEKAMIELTIYRERAAPAKPAQDLVAAISALDCELPLLDERATDEHEATFYSMGHRDAIDAAANLVEALLKGGE